MDTAHHYSEEMQHSRAVVAVPPHFSTPQQQQWRACAEQAGISVLATIEEPVAAAYAAKKIESMVDTTCTLLVVDVGGYCTSASVVGLHANRIETIESR